MLTKESGVLMQLHKRWISLLFALIVTFPMIAMGAPSQPNHQNQSENVLSLAGEWEFYWQQLLEPDDLRQTVTPDFIQVPSSWIGQTLGKQTNDGQPLPQFGYATYRKLLNLKPEQVGVNSALFFRYVDSAFRIWIDGKEYKGSGTVSIDAGKEQPRLAMQLIYFTPTSQTVEIVMQVSNASFRESGIVGDALWAPADTLTRYVFMNIALQDVVFISGFLLLGIYHLIVFFSRRNEFSFLWLGILNVCLAIRSFLLSEYLAMLIFPSITWQQIVRIEYMVEAVAVTSIVFFYHVMYPKDAHRLPLWITIGYTSVLLIYIASTSTAQFTTTLMLHWLIYLLILAYYFIYIGIVSVIRRREGAYLNMFGLMIVMIGILNDTFYYTGQIDTMPLTSIALLTFFFIQALIVAFRYSAMFRNNLELKNELTVLNTQLEHTVGERTQQLSHSVNQLTEMDIKRAQLLENIAHDMGSPVAGLQTHIYVMKNRQLTVEQKTQVLQLMQMNVENLKRQAEDLYDLTGLERNSDAIQVQLMGVHELWELIRVFLEEKVAWEQIELQLGDVKWVEYESKVESQADATLKRLHVNPSGIIRVVQNYLDNAIKFSIHEPCLIRVDYRLVDGWLEFALTDFGKGIHAEELPHVFERFYKGEGNRKGIGLGLSIAKEIIERQGGTVGVHSEEGKGSTFWFTLPLKHDYAD
jgi:signal transduction histidine kinase